MFKCFSRHDTARNAKSKRRWNCGKQTVIRPGWSTSGSVSTSSGRRRLTVPPRRRAAWVGWPSLTSPCRLPCRGWSLAEERDDERLLVVRTSVTDQSDLCWIESNLYNNQFESLSAANNSAWQKNAHSEEQQRQTITENIRTEQKQNMPKSPF